MRRSERKEIIREAVRETREPIKKAFAKLARLGFMTKKRYQCCMGCANSGISTEYAEMDSEKQSKLRGALFYNKQDDECFRETGTLYIRHRMLDSSVKANDWKEIVTNDVLPVLKSYGLDVEWSGDTHHCIVVYAEGCRELQAA